MVKCQLLIVGVMSIICAIAVSMNARVCNFLIILLITFDMGGELGLRSIAFMLMFMSIFQVICTRRTFIVEASMVKELFFLALLLVVWPLILLIKSQYHGYDVFLSISQISSLFFAWGYFVYRMLAPKSCGMDNLLASFYMLSLFYAVMLIVYLCDANIFNSIARFFSDRGLFAGVRRDVLDLPNIYIKSSLFIFFAFSCFVIKSKMKAFVIYIGALLTTSKVLFIFNTLLVVFRVKLRFKFLLLAFFVITLPFTSSFLSSVLLKFSHYLLSAIDVDSITASKRISDFYSVLHYFNNEYIDLFFGFGPGSLMFSDFTNSTVTNIELDHLNTIRKFGLLWFIFFCAYVFYVLLMLKRAGMSGEFIGLLGVFILAGTNPVLISPMFFIVLAECRFKTLKY